MNKVSKKCRKPLPNYIKSLHVPLHIVFQHLFVLLTFSAPSGEVTSEEAMTQIPAIHPGVHITPSSTLSLPASTPQSPPEGVPPSPPGGSTQSPSRPITCGAAPVIVAGSGRCVDKMLLDFRVLIAREPFNKRVHS